MKATDFTRNDCAVGSKRITYAKLKREYRCNACGGRLVVRPGEGWHITCAHCNGQDFIHEREIQRQRGEAIEVIEGLPAEMLEALGLEQTRRDREPQLFKLGQKPIDL